VFFPQSRKHSSSKMIQHVLINTIIFISIEQVVGLALMAGADGVVAHPAVNLARAAQARASQGRVEGHQAQETGVHRLALTGGDHHPAVNRARAAQARASQERVEGPQALTGGVHQVLQIGEVGEVVHPRVRAGRVARAQVNLGRAEAPQVLTGGVHRAPQVTGAHGVHHPAVNLARADPEAEEGEASRVVKVDQVSNQFCVVLV